MFEIEREFSPCQMHSDTNVWAVAEAHVLYGFASYIKSVRIGPTVRVAISDPMENVHDRPFGYFDTG